jgi:hypothetical protein
MVNNPRRAAEDSGTASREEACMSDQGDGPVPQHGDTRTNGRRLLLPGAGAALLLVFVAAAITGPTSAPADPRSATATSSTRSRTPSTAPNTPPAAIAPTPSPTVDADPAALADLDAVAATLTTPLRLTSPTTWDQWLPTGKPFPGKDTADDLSTCPRLADRIGAAVGTKMSYWTGTLPQGPVGCTWATVPLKSGPYAPNYPYLATVGFLDDGTTTNQLSRGFYHHRGRLCPSVAVPAAGEGAYLVRCDDPDGITYTVLTRDTRTPGVWVLSGGARPDAAHPALDVLRPTLEGVAAAFG